jgi:type II secretory pathway pseudopilin PulG
MEMLVVIVIIGVLAGLMLPVFNKAQEKAKMTRCLAEIKTLAFAIAQYQTTYGYLPVAASTRLADFGDVAPATLPTPADTSYLSTDDEYEYARLIGNLACIDSLDPVSPDPTKPQKNDRGLRLLDGAKTVDNPNHPGKALAVFHDPWGRRYRMAFDLDYNGSIAATTEVRGLDSPPTHLLHKDVVIWSAGSDGADILITSSVDFFEGEVNKDNIYSIETKWINGIRPPPPATTGGTPGYHVPK